MPDPIKPKTIYVEVTNTGTQSNRYTELVAAAGYRLRVIIEYDSSVNYQSRARVDVYSSSMCQWNPLADIHWSKLAVKGYGGFTAAACAPDRNVLLHQASLILGFGGLNAE